jgi:hypothetical protein
MQADKIKDTDDFKHQIKLSHPSVATIKINEALDIREKIERTRELPIHHFNLCTKEIRKEQVHVHKMDVNYYYSEILHLPGQNGFAAGTDDFIISKV